MKEKNFTGIFFNEVQCHRNNFLLIIELSWTDTTSLASNHSATSQGSPPGPVQIAVDVVNCNPAASSLPKQPPHVPEDAGSERDYVV